MNECFIAPAARLDVLEIWNYYAIELANLEAADRLRDDLFDAIRHLAQQPHLGHLRRDLAKEPLRFWRVRRYLIIYRSEKSPVEIVRVLHGARDVRAILDSG
jgi:toxin ParE1/3/4